MTTSELNGLQGDLGQTIRRYLSDRRVLIGAASIALVAGAALNWGWLVALGIAPALLSLLPCLIVCGVGVGCMKMMAGSGEKQLNQSNDAAPTAGSSSVAGISTMRSSSAPGASCCHGDADEAQLSQAKHLQPVNERSESNA